MPSKQQVVALTSQGLGYPEIGRRLGIPAGQAYLIATGMAADGGDTATAGDREHRGLETASQSLANPPADNPTGKQMVHEWIQQRVAADGQMRAAQEQASARGSS